MMNVLNTVRGVLNGLLIYFFVAASILFANRREKHSAKKCLQLIIN